MEKQIKKSQKDKHILYLNAFKQTINNYSEKMKTDEDVSLHLKRAVFYGVQIVNSIDRSSPFSEEMAKSNFEITNVIRTLMGLLTPREFENLFPIRKMYDGKKWQSKDYFYTRNYLNSLDPNETIGEEEVLSFLCEYQNLDITMFTVNLMGAMSNLRELDGCPSIMEEWANKNGIEVSRLKEDEKGNKFILKDGKTTKVRKPRPSYLRLVTSGGFSNDN